MVFYISSDPPPLKFRERYVPSLGGWPTSLDHAVLNRKPVAMASEIWVVTARKKKNVFYYVQGVRRKVTISDSSSCFGTDFTEFG